MRPGAHELHVEARFMTARLLAPPPADPALAASYVAYYTPWVLSKVKNFMARQRELAFGVSAKKLVRPGPGPACLLCSVGAGRLRAAACWQAGAACMPSTTAAAAARRASCRFCHPRRQKDCSCCPTSM